MSWKSHSTWHLLILNGPYLMGPLQLHDCVGRLRRPHWTICQLSGWCQRGHLSREALRWLQFVCHGLGSIQHLELCIVFWGCSWRLVRWGARGLLGSVMQRGGLRVGDCWAQSNVIVLFVGQKGQVGTTGHLCPIQWTAIWGNQERSPMSNNLSKYPISMDRGYWGDKTPPDVPLSC